MSNVPVDEQTSALVTAEADRAGLSKGDLVAVAVVEFLSVQTPTPVDKQAR